jgi:hypothetical protein
MAIKAFNSVGGFSVGESAANVILANGDITTSNANLSANLFVTDTANVGNLRTDNLLYANGTAWDFANPAGGNAEIQYSDGNGGFAASANLKFDYTNNVLVVTGNVNANNANLGNLATASFVNVSNNLNVTGTANVGNLRTDNLLHANGAAWDFANPAGSNTQVQFNNGNGDFGASANFTFDTATNLLAVTGNISASNANLGNTATASYFTGTLTTNAQPNITSVGNLSSLNVDGVVNLGNALNVQGNIAANSSINANGTITGANLVEGMLIYVTDANGAGNGCFQLYNGSGWKCIERACNN